MSYQHPKSLVMGKLCRTSADIGIILVHAYGHGFGIFSCCHMRLHVAILLHSSIARVIIFELCGLLSDFNPCSARSSGCCSYHIYHTTLA